ncbi:MAG: ABC transporter ATP-binding protein [Armatimonadaceae bacterium]
MRPGPQSTPPKKGMNKQTVKRVIALFAEHKPTLALIVVLVLASAATGILPPYYLKKIVDEGFGPRNLSVVTHYTLLTLAATLGATAFNLAYGYLSVLVGQRILKDIRNRLFEHLQGMGLKFFTSTRTGEIQSRLIGDVAGVQGVLSDTLANFLSNVAIVISTLIGMIAMDWRLTLLSVGILPLFALLSARLGIKLGDLRTQSAKQNADLSSTMQETLSVSGILLLKTTGQSKRALDRFVTENDALTSTQIRSMSILRLFFNLIPLTFQLTPALVYWLAGYFMAQPSGTGLTIGLIVAFTALQSRLFFPLTSLMNIQVEVISGMSLFDRVYEYLDMPHDIREVEHPTEIDINKAKGEVSFTDVTFKHDPDGADLTLDHVTFTAKPGERVALVGASGAGKTTMAFLIPRLHDPLSGTVSIDGVDIRNLSFQNLGRLVGVVTQETYLLHDSIKENLRYGNPAATDNEIEAAARAAAIHDHIASLPEGYETVVGERGYKLSGGEKQRLAIARAILQNPKVLVLDEATSALDTQTEAAVQESLARLAAGRTTFAIAHRLSTVVDADRILVMDQGRLVEQGTHSDLLAAGGKYAELVAAQWAISGPDAPTPGA